MPIYVGSTEICTLGDLKIGSADVQAVYVGSTQIFPCASTIGQCFTFNASKICVPLAATGFVGGVSNGNWYVELEFNLQDLGTSDFQPLFEVINPPFPNGYLSLAFEWSGGVDIWRVRLGTTSGSKLYVGHTIEPQENTWYKLRFGYDGVQDAQWLQIEDLSTLESETLWSTFGGVPSEYTDVGDVLCIGSASFWTNDLSYGNFRNVKIVQNDVVLAHWPIMGQESDDGVTIDDIVGNNDGSISVLGSGTWGECTAYSDPTPTKTAITIADWDAATLNGWTDTTGTLTLRTTSPDPVVGSNYFAGGTTDPVTTSYQDIDLTGDISDFTLIDTGTAVFRLVWWQASLVGADTGTIEVGFYNSVGGTLLGSTALAQIAPLPANTWIERVSQAYIPTGTRAVKLTMNMTRNSGTGLNCYIDSIVAHVQDIPE